MVVAVGAALAGLSTVLTDFRWWWVGMLHVVVVFGSAAVVRQFARTRWWGSLAAVLASAAALTMTFAPQTALVGLIPTPDTFAAFRELDAAGREAIAIQSVPANADTGIVFLLCLGVSVLAVVMDLLAQSLRLVALAGVPLLVLLLVPSFVRAEFNDPFLFAVTAAAYLGMLVAPSRPPGRRTALAIGAVAVIAAVIVPIALPRVESGDIATGGYGLAAGINPIISLGNDLRRGTATPALTYTTSDRMGEYLRLTALDDFTGAEWSPTPSTGLEANDVAAIGPAPGLGGDVPTRAVTTDVTVAGILSQWLPVPYAPTSITGLEGDWSWEPLALGVRSEQSNARGQVYTVESLAVEPTVEQLVAAGAAVLPELDRYLAVPEDLPPVVASTALEVVGAAATNYDKAVALQDFFRSGAFTYSEQAPVEQGYDGSGASVLAPFLEAKSGYCVHFSSSMAAMARTLGIPSRVAVGFTQGDPVNRPEDDQIEFTVTTHNLHAWPELFFSGVGWVRFEPTPGRGSVPVFAPLAKDDPTTPDVDESVPPPPPPTTTAPTSTPTAAPVLPDTPVDSAAGAPGTKTQAVNWAWLAGALVLLLLLTPFAVRTIRRSQRLAAVDGGSALAGWQELRDTADDLGMHPTDTWTPRQLADSLAPALDDGAAAALARLRAAVEAEAFAGVVGAAETVGAASVADVRAASRSLRRNAGVTRRLVGALLPRSVLYRWLPRLAIA